MTKLTYCKISSGKNKGKIKYIKSGKTYYVSTVDQVPDSQRGKKKTFDKPKIYKRKGRGKRSSVKVEKKKLSEKEKMVIKLQSIRRGQKARAEYYSMKMTDIRKKCQIMFQPLADLKTKITILEMKKGTTSRRASRDTRTRSEKGGSPDIKFFAKKFASGPFTKEDKKKMTSLKRQFNKEVKKSKYKNHIKKLTPRQYQICVPYELRPYI